MRPDSTRNAVEMPSIRKSQSDNDSVEPGHDARMTGCPVHDDEPPSGKIRICFVIAMIATERAGTEGHLLRLIRSLDRRRFEPLLVVMQRSPWTDEFDDPLVPMKVLGFRSFLRPTDWNCIVRLARILKQERVRIVESHFPDAHFAGALAARLAAVPVVVSCRRDMVDRYGWKKRTLCRLGKCSGTHYLANSHAAAAAALRVEGMRESRIEVIHNGVDLEAFERPPRASTIPEFEVSADRNRMVVLVANLRPVKNISMFIDAASIVARQFDDVCFAVLGTGSELEPLKQRAVERGVERRMIWAGRVPDVRPYLKKSTIACLTSDSEGFSNSILEYMAAGLPVVATQVGGASEAILDGATGYVVPKGDAQAMASRLADLLAHPAKSQAMGTAGRQRVTECFSLQTQLDAHQRLYERLADASRESSSV